MKKIEFKIFGQALDMLRHFDNELPEFLDCRIYLENNVSIVNWGMVYTLAKAFI